MHKIDKKNLITFLNKYVKHNDKILDIGCGIGENITIIKGAGFNNIIGVDISADMVNESRLKGHEAYDINILNELHLKDIDILLFSHVLEHINYPDIVQIMENYFAMCKTEAKIIIIMPILYDAFFNDVDHIKPYYPDGLMTLFSNKVVSRQYKSDYNLQIIDIEYRKEIWIPYNVKSRLIRTTYNKIIYKIITKLMSFLKIVSFGILSKTTGYVAIFKLTKNL